MKNSHLKLLFANYYYTIEIVTWDQIDVSIMSEVIFWVGLDFMAYQPL